MYTFFKILDLGPPWHISELIKIPHSEVYTFGKFLQNITLWHKEHGIFLGGMSLKLDTTVIFQHSKIWQLYSK
jgi:hypothetical protein